MFVVMEYLAGGSLNEKLGFATNSISSKRAQRESLPPTLLHNTHTAACEPLAEPPTPSTPPHHTPPPGRRWVGRRPMGLPLLQALKAAVQLASALDYMHCKALPGEANQGD